MKPGDLVRQPLDQLRAALLVIAIDPHGRVLTLSGGQLQWWSWLDWLVDLLICVSCARPVVDLGP